MAKSRVAVVRCAEYQDEQVYAAVKKGLDLLGGITAFVRPGERIVMKPNVLIASSPEKCVTTHPAVFKAVARLLLAAGAKVSYGDSPSFGGADFNFKRSGLKQIGEEMGLTLADFDHGREVVHKEGLLNKKFVIAKGVLDADGLISLPKMKTHGLTRFTGAVKNQFGCIPGILKGQFHVKMPDPFSFATMLVDINTLIRPRLYIMDGIVAMEGNGPRTGKPRRMEVLLLSADPIAVDAIACKIIDLNPEFVPTSKPGEKAGLGTYHFETIELVGDSIDEFITRDFEVVRKPPAPATSGWVRTLLKNYATPRPVIDRKKCSGCGTCLKMCPVGPTALDWMEHEAGKPPRHNYSRCIRCYCCQEICPEGAISIKSPLLGRLVFRN
jgi:uncharacterized protein (DUF362 family)/Pyruvate/2-oxoacid:ferredoxin oxidoreductase delta subunit